MDQVLDQIMLPSQDPERRGEQYDPEYLRIDPAAHGNAILALLVSKCKGNMVQTAGTWEAGLSVGLNCPDGHL